MRTWHSPHFIITHKFFNVAFLQSFSGIVGYHMKQEFYMHYKEKII